MSSLWIHEKTTKILTQNAEFAISAKDMINNLGDKFKDGTESVKVKNIRKFI